MKQEHIEQKLRDAVDHAAPAFSDGLGAEAARGGAPRQGRRPRRRWVAAVAAVAACAILAVGALGIIRASAAHQPAAVVALDVNPSILLTIDGGERVLKVEAKNDDARRVIDGMDLTGVPLNVAVNALIGSLLQNGYISELANSILVSVEGGDQQRAAALQERLTREIDELLAGFGVQGAVLSQTLGADDELDALAAAYDISRGKAALIQELLAQNPMLRAEDLAGLTINALGLLLSEAQPAGGVSLTGTASESGYIGADAAAAAAYAHAGVAQADAQLISVEMDVEAGRMVYEVEFLSGGLAYEYDVDAVSGEIVKSSSEDRGALTAGAADGADIGSDAALAAALAHAGVTQAQASGIRVDRDREDGRLVYDIDFISGELEYDYEIDAATGAVIKQSREQYRGASGGGSIPASSTDIGSDAALQAALAHAGVAQADATGVRVEREYDDGRVVYEVDFYAGSVEYDYEIDAATGAVLKSSRETYGSAPSGGASGADIGGEAALQAALAHAGVAQADATGVRVEREYDDGLLVYDVDFYAGSVEYDYEIAGADGTVLHSSEERYGSAGGNSAGNTTGGNTTGGNTTGGNASGSGDIGSDAALQAALAHAGVAQADATGVRVKRDRDDGRLVYDVDFYAGNAEYEYTIAAADGAVLESSRESFDGGGTGGNASGGNTTGGNASGGDIGADRAQSIALGHAGLAAGDVYGLKTERDRDNGVTVYEVEFKAGGYEYDYEINASTGEILGHSREYDD